MLLVWFFWEADDNIKFSIPDVSKQVFYICRSYRWEAHLNNVESVSSAGSRTVPRSLESYAEMVSQVVMVIKCGCLERVAGVDSLCS